MAIITLLAAAVRFATLDTQSFWYDEALTVDLVRQSFGGMVEGVLEDQAQPPPYFVLAWLWAHVFGDGEVGLRSLSALLGTLTAPVAYAIGNLVAGRRVANAVGLLTALSPALVWYSQEARAYALVTLLCALALLFLLRALERPNGRDLAGWAVASVLAVASHYFALFAVLPQAAWLLWRCDDRRLVVRTLAGTAVGLVAIVPMLLYQQAHGGVDWIAELPLSPRVRDTAFLFVAGPTGASTLTFHRVEVAWVATAAMALTAAAAFAWWDARVRERLLLALAVAAGVIVIPLAGALAGPDYLLDRNLLPALIPLTVIAATGLCARRLKLVGPAVVAIVCLGFAGIVLAATPRNAERQRDDWRGVAEHVGPARGDRLFVVSPYWHAITLDLYLPRMTPMLLPASVQTVYTVELEGFVPFGDEVTTIAPPPPFRETRYSRVQRLTVREYTAPAPVRLDPDQLSGEGRNRGEPFFEPAAAAGAGS